MQTDDADAADHRRPEVDSGQLAEAARLQQARHQDAATNIRCLYQRRRRQGRDDVFHTPALSRPTPRGAKCI